MEPGRATRLGVDVPLRTAFAAYYRSQFLNATLPGGVLGDVHRGVSHGRETGAMGRGLRSVAWDRAIGQVVQAVLALAAVALLVPAVRGAGAAGCDSSPRSCSPSCAASLPRRAPLRSWPRTCAPARTACGRSSRSPPLLAAAGHVVVFLVAARTAGVDRPAARAAALALVVLLASAVPVGIAGWGPREGAAAWVFGAVGLGAARASPWRWCTA